MPLGTQLATENRIFENSVSERPELRRPLYSGRRNLCSLLNPFAKMVHFGKLRSPCPFSEFAPSRNPFSPLPWSSRGISRRCSTAGPSRPSFYLGALETRILRTSAKDARPTTFPIQFSALPWTLRGASCASCRHASCEQASSRPAP